MIQKLSHLVHVLATQMEGQGGGRGRSFYAHKREVYIGSYADEHIKSRSWNQEQHAILAATR